MPSKNPLNNCFRAFANGNGQAKYTVFTSRIRDCWLFIDVSHSLGAKQRDNPFEGEYFLFGYTLRLGNLKTEVSLWKQTHQNASNVFCPHYDGATVKPKNHELGQGNNVIMMTSSLSKFAFLPRENQKLTFSNHS